MESYILLYLESTNIFFTIYFIYNLESVLI